MGGALPPDRRAAVVDWARASGGLVLEDDYDGEFRYDRQPVGALQGLDPERVVYLGTASKSLAPGLRLGWMVVPEGLVGEVVAAEGGRGLGVERAGPAGLRRVPVLGGVRPARTGHAAALPAAPGPAGGGGGRALARDAGSGIAAGLHAVLALPPGTEQDVLRAAAWHGLAVLGLNRFRRPGVRADLDGLVVGYATPPDSGWQSALRTLCRVLP
ncbi:GntR family transcriptional regulator [Streptomyces narbonensis]